MPDVYIEDVIAPNYDKLLDDVLDHRHSQYICLLYTSPSPRDA